MDMDQLAAMIPKPTLQSIKYNSGSLQILDQLLLPTESKYVTINGVDDGWHAIKKMQVRGAPAIAIVACLSLAVEIHKGTISNKKSLLNYIADKLKYLVSARPTAVNVKTAAEILNKLACNLSEDDSVDVAAMKEKFIERVEFMLGKDVEDNTAIGNCGASEILQNSRDSDLIRILTHCNTGSLATAGYGTALGVIRSLYAQGRLEHAYCTETRPYNQGARLTAYELVYDKIPCTLITDSMVSALIKHKNISAIVVGADRVAANGDTANKIGTYQMAVVAKYHGIPFYVAAPFTSIDFNISSGEHIQIEERPEIELTYIESIRIAAEGIRCWNPAFDVTPAHLITKFFTDKGVFKPSDVIKQG